MTWNYRIMKREVSTNEFEFGIYEVYYNEDGTIKSWTKDSLVPVVDSSGGLKFEMESMFKAFDKEVVQYKEDE
jgi:hypothetical protein